MSNPYARDSLGVFLGELEVRIPWAPADRWISGCLAGPVTLLVALTGPDTGMAVTEALLEERVSPQEADQAAYTLLERATPYRWWKAVRLVGLSAGDTTAGALTLKGLDPRTLTIGQWVTAVYALYTNGADQKGKFKIDALLDDPPAGVLEWQTDAEFNAMVEAARSAPGQT